MKKSKLLLVLMLILTIFTLTSCDAYYAWAEQFNKLNGGKYVIPEEITEDDKMPLKVLYPNSGMSNFANSWTTNYFQRITGYQVTYEQTLGEAASVVTNILSTNQPYHLLKLEAGNYLGLVNDKCFVDLAPALEAYGKDLLEIIPQAAWDAVTSEDGKIYAIPETGFSGMIGNALVWNMKHLNNAGITKVPETISEVNTALYAMFNLYRAGDSDKGIEAVPKYRAFAMGAAQAYMSTLAAAWDLPENFYVNEDNKIEHVMYLPQYKSYMSWLNKLQRDGLISSAWENYADTTVISNMAKGVLGCGYLSYWNINSLVTQYAKQNQITEEEARENFKWSVYIKGDGEFGTPVQEEAKFISYTTIGYYCAVPLHMSRYTPYVVDWMNQRIKKEAFEGYRLGDETTADKPEDGHYYVSDENDPNAVLVNIGGEDKYIVTTPKYSKDILPTSMYQTGVHPEVGSELWILSEKSYNAWSVLVDNESPNAIKNAMAMAPYLDGWSDIDIAARSTVLTCEQLMINAESVEDFESEFNSLKSTWENEIWTSKISGPVQAWQESKTNNPSDDEENQEAGE